MKLQTFTTSSGYTLQYRVLPLDLRTMIIAAVRADWSTSTDTTLHPPKPPTTQVETAPGVVETKINDKDPAYLNALSAYDRRVEASPDVTRRIVQAITAATTCDIDDDALTAHRALCDAIGVTLPDGVTDKELFLWHVALPDTDEQLKYQGLVFGTQWAAIVEAQRRAFRRAMESATDRISENAVGELGI